MELGGPEIDRQILEDRLRVFHDFEVEIDPKGEHVIL